MGKKLLQIQQLNGKMLAYADLQKVVLPPIGWIKAICTAMGMSMQQLGNRLSSYRYKNLCAVCAKMG